MIRKHRNKTFTITHSLPTTLFGCEMDKHEFIRTIIYDMLCDTIVCYTSDKKKYKYFMYDKRSNTHSLFINNNEITVHAYIAILKSLLEDN